MSLRNKIHRKNSLTHFGHLRSRSSLKTAFLWKGTPSCTSYSGSLTVETALTLPVFICCLAAFVFLFHVQQIQLQMEMALHATADHLAQYACLENGESKKSGLMQNVVEYSAAELYLRSQMKKQGVRMEEISGKNAGVSLLGSELGGDDIHLKASYQIVLPVALPKIRELPMQQTVCVRKWTGRKRETDETDWVYITPTGTVWHESCECPYLDLTIQSIKEAELTARRNKSGGRYTACRLCGACAHTVVYITDYGNVYHGTLECSGLKRTVYRIKKSEASGKRGCKKCGKGEEKK